MTAVMMKSENDQTDEPLVSLPIFDSGESDAKRHLSGERALRSNELHSSMGAYEEVCHRVVVGATCNPARSGASGDERRSESLAGGFGVSGLSVHFDAAAVREGFGLISHCGTALVYNGLGRYEAAFAAAERACEYPHGLGFLTVVLPELIEAASRSGKADRAADALHRLAEVTRAAGTDWALGIEARSAALLNEGEVAERLYQEAIERLGRTAARLELARAHLLYGESLRRVNRRSDARDELRAAHELFVELGAEDFAERARRELLATGETARKRSVETRYELTAQEEQIARRADEGRTNPEIAMELFISARTVEWHLSKVYMKLGIRSRRELRDALPEPEGSAGSASRAA
jgi:DNA-binding CsgD family transcriptional regulator